MIINRGDLRSVTVKPPIDVPISREYVTMFMIAFSSKPTNRQQREQKRAKGREGRRRKVNDSVKIILVQQNEK